MSSSGLESPPLTKLRTLTNDPRVTTPGSNDLVVQLHVLAADSVSVIFFTWPRARIHTRREVPKVATAMAKE
jgi:hypothetical protein